LPESVFLVGADTAARIVHPRFYADSEEKLHDALALIRSHRCRFLVAGRVNAEGEFLGLAGANVPAPFEDLFSEIPEANFRLDVSSTELRENARATTCG
jgi:hypothetical protein